MKVKYKTISPYYFILQRNKQENKKKKERKREDRRQSQANW